MRDVAVNTEEEVNKGTAVKSDYVHSEGSPLARRIVTAAAQNRGLKLRAKNLKLQPILSTFGQQALSEASSPTHALASPSASEQVPASSIAVEGRLKLGTAFKFSVADGLGSEKSKKLRELIRLQEARFGALHQPKSPSSPQDAAAIPEKESTPKESATTEGSATIHPVNTPDGPQNFSEAQLLRSGSNTYPYPKRGPELTNMNTHTEVEKNSDPKSNSSLRWNLNLTPKLNPNLNLAPKLNLSQTSNPTPSSSPHLNLNLNLDMNKNANVSVSPSPRKMITGLEEEKDGGKNGSKRPLIKVIDEHNEEDVSVRYNDDTPTCAQSPRRVAKLPVKKEEAGFFALLRSTWAKYLVGASPKGSRKHTRFNVYRNCGCIQVLTQGWPQRCRTGG